MEKTFKYHDYLSKYPNCPDINFKHFQIVFYRWLHVNDHEDNFKPALLINPNRTFEKDEITCLAYGLSVFDSEENAYKKLVERKRNLKEKLGELIGEIAIKKDEGIASEPEINNFGHFTFFEYSDVNLSNKITKFVKIFNENGEFAR